MMKKGGNDNARLVYSSESGRICPHCSRPVGGCVCRKTKGVPAGDGIVRIRRETKGRGGKTMTVVTGIPLDEAGLKALADFKNLSSLNLSQTTVTDAGFKDLMKKIFHLAMVHAENRFCNAFCHLLHEFRDPGCLIGHVFVSHFCMINDEYIGLTVDRSTAAV